MHYWILSKIDALPYLERYFSRFSLATREAVQLIVIDMYAPYVSLVKSFSRMLS